MGNRVAHWNYTRGLDYWKSDLSVKILSEEVREFWVAYAERRFIDMLDAYADVRFVLEGREFLYSVHHFQTIQELNELTSDYKTVKEYGDNQLHSIKNILLDLGLTMNNLNSIFEIVCDANDKKHAEKNGDGKITKGPDWYKPEAKIEEYINKLNLKIEFK